ncbi:hypothetical protein BU17DRAFT_97813 [Hysterangium stoloniferum]|nr:hypothetical protein BU17DRAFT_97813 [Hysterangium stoloniferum]
MINKKRNSSSTRSYTPENPPTTFYHFQTFTSHLLEEANSSNRPCHAHSHNWPRAFEHSHPSHPPLLANSRICKVLTEPSSQLPKKAASTKRHGSAPKRARLSAVSRPDSDDDDEKILSARIEPRHAMQTPTQMPMCSWTMAWTLTRNLHLVPRLDNDSRAACDETNPPPAATAQPSPSKVHAVITHLKANVEIQAATQAQTDGGGDLSAVPKMDSPESDESGLELELDTIVKGLDARCTVASASAHTSTFNEVNTRQSTHHLPNRDVKVKLFRDDSPGPSTPRTTFKPKPKSNVACPLDTLLKDNRRDEARKGRVEGKRDTKADVGM